MKYTKIITFIGVLVLIVSVLCACEITFGEEPTTTTTTSTTTTTTEAETEPSTTTTTEKKIETDSLDTLLNLIKDFPLGTAGSSVKADNIAYRILNYTEYSNFDINDVKNDYNNFLSTLSDTQKLIYEENFAEIDYVVRKIINDKDYASLSGYTAAPKDGERFSLLNYETLYDVIAK